MIKQGFRVKKDLNTQTPLLEMRGGVFDLMKLPAVRLGRTGYSGEGE